MVEVMPGTGIYWYPASKAHVQAGSKNATQLSSLCLDVFFTRDILRKSNLKGGGSKYQRLNKEIITAIQSKSTCK